MVPSLPTVIIKYHTVILQVISSKQNDKLKSVLSVIPTVRLLAERGGAAASFYPQRVPAEADEGEAAPERSEQQLPGARPLR